MNDLPNELINMILENCDYNTLLALQKVNKKMKMLVQNEVLWMNQCSSSFPHFREILGLNSTNIQPLSLNDCGFRPSKENLVKYGLSEKGWKRTFLAYLKVANSIQTGNNRIKSVAKKKYNQAMILWGVLFVFLLIVVGLAMAGCMMIPFAAEALEKKSRPNCLVSFTFSGITFSIGVVAASFYFVFKNSDCGYFLLLILICFLIPPALWLDGVMKTSIYIPLIPYEIAYLCLILYFANRFLKKCAFYPILLNLLAIVCSFASFLLVVLKADGIGSYCWTISLIPMYVAYWFAHCHIIDYLFCKDHDLCYSYACTVVLFILLLLQSLLLTLRMDRFVKGHFCLYFIPLFLYILVGLIKLCLYSYSFWRKAHKHSKNAMNDCYVKMPPPKPAENEALLLCYLK
ncbi:uncharacterized protein MONOS_17868 [Monocercomonoides exilis]|uniref:uncharacterized protein n=1 Tax=Monocercomonoides exilis TaxID=2049356 RepID=UPI00355AB25F|nr:hypothetical protein MONOS_17868 [Monocercomonoides exilis]